MSASSETPPDGATADSAAPARATPAGATRARTMPEFETARSEASVASLLAAAEAARTAALEPPSSDEDGAGAASSGTPTPRSRRDRVVATLRSPWLAFAVGAAIVLAPLLAAPHIEEAQAAADVDAVSALVDEYVQAIAAGDAETANALAPPDPDVASTALLTDDVLGAIALPSLDVDAPHVEGDEATVLVSLSMQQWGSMSATVRLEREGGGWRIAEGLLARARLWNPELIAEVAGVDVEELDDQGGAVWGYPGVYSTTARGGNDLVALAGATAGLLPMLGESWIGISLEPTPELEAAAAEAAVEFVEACATRFAPGCPASAQGLGAVDDVASSSGQVWVQDDTTLTVEVSVRRVGVVGSTTSIWVLVPALDDAPLEHLTLWAPEGSQLAGVSVP